MSFLYQQQLNKIKLKKVIYFKSTEERLHESFFHEKTQLKYPIYELNSYLQIGDIKNMRFLTPNFFFPEFSIFINTLPILLSHTISWVPISFP